MAQQQSLFPVRSSVQQVEKEGLAMLPITAPNQLLTLLRMHQNTIIHLADQERRHADITAMEIYSEAE